MKAPRLFLFQIGGEKMPYIPPEVVAKAREMDLLTYLKNYEPHELVHFGGNTYCTREHDSLKISNGKWCWFSRGIGGYSALDYLIKVKEIPFTEAVEMIMGRAAVSPPVFTPRPKEEKPKVLLLPKVDRCATHAVEYLHRRGIDYGLIEFCISTGRLYRKYPISQCRVRWYGFKRQSPLCKSARYRLGFHRGRKRQRQALLFRNPRRR